MVEVNNAMTSRMLPAHFSSAWAKSRVLRRLSTVRESYLSESTEAVLLVDTTNAFNSLNRNAALHNIRHVCPSLATVIINTYQNASELFVDGSTFFLKKAPLKATPWLCQCIPWLLSLLLTYWTSVLI